MSLTIILQSENAVQQLEAIKQLTGLPTYEQVFNDALAFFEVAAKKRTEGWKVVAVNKAMNQFTVLNMDSLNRVGQLDDVQAQADDPAA